MSLGFRGRILLAFTVLLVSGWAVTSLVISRKLAKELEESQVRHASALARNLADWSAESLLTENRIDLLHLAQGTVRANEDVVYVYILDPFAEVAAHSFPGALPSALRRATAGRARTLLDTEEGRVLDLQAPVLEGRGGEVHVGYSRRRLLAGVGAMERVLWTVAVPVLLLGLAAVGFLSGLLTRSARRLADVVERFGGGEWAVRADGGGTGEIGTLARAFNGMAENLQRQAERLSYLTQYNRNLIDNLGAGLYVLDPDMRLEFANEEIAAAAPRRIGLRCHEALYGLETPCEGCVALAVLDGAGPRVGRRLTAGRWLEESAIPIPRSDGRPSVVVVRRDVTEAVRLREHDARTQKLAAVGELAATVSHEVNNPLDGMQSLLRLTLDDPALAPGLQEHLELVQGGLLRIELCVRRLLLIAADSPEPATVTTVRQQLEQARALAEPVLRDADASLTVEIDPFLPPILVQPGRSPQLFVNLILVAADAAGRDLGVRVRARPATGGVCVTVEAAPAAGEAASEVGRLLPFFLERSGEGGSVLGLAVARQIAEEHGGRLVVRDVGDGGAAYDLFLPACAAASAALPREVAP